LSQCWIQRLGPLQRYACILLLDFQIGFRVRARVDEVVGKGNVDVSEGVCDLLDHGLVAIDVFELWNFNHVSSLVHFLLFLVLLLHFTNILEVTSMYVILKQSIKMLYHEQIVSRIELPH